MLKAIIDANEFTKNEVLQRRQLTPLAETYAEFKSWLPVVLDSLKPGIPQLLLLRGEFVGIDEPNWDLVEEVQMDIRLGDIPEDVWIMIRGEYPELYVHFLKVRF